MIGLTDIFAMMGSNFFAWVTIGGIVFTVFWVLFVWLVDRFGK